MYTLQVFYSGAGSPAESHKVYSATEVLDRIPELLREHEGCKRIVVMGGNSRLFSVGCTGDRLPG